MALCMKSSVAGPDEPMMPIVYLALVLLESAIFKIPTKMSRAPQKQDTE